MSTDDVVERLQQDVHGLTEQLEEVKSQLTELKKEHASLWRAVTEMQPLVNSLRTYGGSK